MKCFIFIFLILASSTLIKIYKAYIVLAPDANAGKLSYITIEERVVSTALELSN